MSAEINRPASRAALRKRPDRCGMAIDRTVPGEPARVITVAPKGDGVLDRLHRLLAVERDRLAVRLDLPAAP